jgi:hypothetical protein
VLEGIALVGDPGTLIKAWCLTLTASIYSIHSSMENRMCAAPAPHMTVHTILFDVRVCLCLQSSPSWTKRTHTLRSGCCAMTSRACRPPCATWCAVPSVLCPSAACQALSSKCAVLTASVITVHYNAGLACAPAAWCRVQVYLSSGCLYIKHAQARIQILV